MEKEVQKGIRGKTRSIFTLSHFKKLLEIVKTEMTNSLHW